MKKLQLSAMLDKIALNQYFKHQAKKEWGVFIAFIFLVKVITWGISVYAGFYYLKFFIQTTIVESEVGAKFFAIIFLISWEVLTTVSLVKFFKFLLRTELKSASSILIIVVLFFGISFYTSTQGLSMRQSDKADTTNDILMKEKIQKANAEKEYQGLINDINSQINTIKANPEGWSGGRRTVLLAHQNRQIDSLFQRKATIQKEYKTDIFLIQEEAKNNLELNKSEQTSEASKYYNIITWIMIIQFLSSGILMFFWRKIYLEKEENRKLELSDAVNETVDKTENTLKNAMVNTVNNFNNELDLIFNQRLLTPTQSKYSKIVYEDDSFDITEKLKERREAGFLAGREIVRKNAEQSGRTNTPEPTQKQLKFIKDHEKLIIFFLKNPQYPTTDKAREQGYIPNCDLGEIMEGAKNYGASFAKKTTVRTAYQHVEALRERLTIENNKIKII